MIVIRSGMEIDRKQIAECIAEAFEKDFSVLSHDNNIVSKAIESGIQVERFFVASEGEKIVGVLAVADCNGRSIITDSRAYKKYFGLVKGIIATCVLKEEFEKKLEYPDTTGYIESVAVRKDYRRMGITTKLLTNAVNESKYSEYELDVTNINHGAIQCYEKFGFMEYKREEVKYAKQKGFSEKIYMKYKQ